MTRQISRSCVRLHQNCNRLALHCCCWLQSFDQHTSASRCCCSIHQLLFMGRRCIAHLQSAYHLAYPHPRLQKLYTSRADVSLLLMPCCLLLQGSEMHSTHMMSEADALKLMHQGHSHPKQHPHAHQSSYQHGSTSNGSRAHFSSQSTANHAGSRSGAGLFVPDLFPREVS